MARTTLSIDTPILDQVKRIQKEERTSLGQIVTRLLAEALQLRKNRLTDSEELRWTSREMQAQVDLLDKEAVYSALDHGAGSEK